MTLEPLKITKRWRENNAVQEADWDEIRDKVVEWGLKTNNNLKQLGLDVNGADYEFNNVGRATQTSSIVARLDALELSRATPGATNLGLDISATNIVKIVSSDGTDLSSSNIGYVTLNDKANAGQLVTRQVTANLQLNY